MPFNNNVVSFKKFNLPLVVISLLAAVLIGLIGRYFLQHNNFSPTDPSTVTSTNVIPQKNDSLQSILADEKSKLATTSERQAQLEKSIQQAEQLIASSDAMLAAHNSNSRPDQMGSSTPDTDVIRNKLDQLRLDTK
jgi:septal ring factor EnvC (AmiA/AmiB activator)